MIKSKHVISLRVLAIVLLGGMVIYASEASSPRQTHAGMTCFTVELDTDAQTHSKSCNDLCSDKGAVCTGASGIFNPPATCESGIAGQFCRCCAVTP